MIVRKSDKEPQEIQPGLLRSILGYGERLMLVEVSLKQGTRVEAHAHPHEQITYVVEGRVRFTLNGTASILTCGDTCLIKPGEPHAAEALSDCVLLDAFSPPRKDFFD